MNCLGLQYFLGRLYHLQLLIQLVMSLKYTFMAAVGLLGGEHSETERAMDFLILALATFLSR